MVSLCKGKRLRKNRKIFLLFFITVYSYAQQQSSPYFYSLWGHYVRAKGPDNAYPWFDQLIKQGFLGAGYAGIIHALFDAAKFQDIVNLESEISTYLSENLDVQMVFVKSCEMCGLRAKAEQRLIDLARYASRHQEIAYGSAIAHLHNAQPEKSLILIDDFLKLHEQTIPTAFIFHFLKSQIYMHLQRPAQAAESISRALELNPKFEQGWLFSGLIYEQLGDIKQAINGYKFFLSLVGKHYYAEQQLIRLTMQSRVAQPVSRKGTVQEYLEEGAAYYYQQQFDKSLSALRQCIQADPACRPALLLMLNIFYQTDQIQAALGLLEKLINHQPKDQGWYRSLYNLYHAKNVKKDVVRILKFAADGDVQNLPAVLYLADILVYEKKYQQAIVYLKKSCTLATSLSLRSKIVYQLAQVYCELGDFNNVHTIIQQEIACINYYVPLQNLIAYYYATQGKDLAKAQIWITKALMKEPTHVHYLDTQALIWYKQGIYDKAIKLLHVLERAHPKDYYIQRHLSKALHKAGEKNAAIALLKKTVEYAPNKITKDRTYKLLQRWQA